LVHVACTPWYLGTAVLWLYDIMNYTTSCFGAAEPSAPDQGFEIDPDVVINFVRGSVLNRTIIFCGRKSFSGTFKRRRVDI